MRCARQNPEAASSARHRCGGDGHSCLYRLHRSSSAGRQRPAAAALLSAEPGLHHGVAPAPLRSPPDLHRRPENLVDWGRRPRPGATVLPRLVDHRCAEARRKHRRHCDGTTRHLRRHDRGHPRRPSGLRPALHSPHPGGNPYRCSPAARHRYRSRGSDRCRHRPPDAERRRTCGGDGGRARGTTLPAVVLRQNRARTRLRTPGGALSSRNPGGVLLSQGVSSQVPSALEGLTAVFGMGTGVPPPLLPPETLSRDAGQ